MKIIKMFGALFVVGIVGIVIIIIISVTQPSGFSNCVIVENEKQFTGNWLKYEFSIYHKVVPTQECERFDREVDFLNGRKKGVVRWAECPKGPDCDEAGMF